MIKTVDFMPRRRDLDRAAFRTYYEERHAPLAVPLFPFSRYRRNHLIDQGVEPGFDCLSEFWVRSLDEIGALMAGEAGATMIADEHHFLDREANIAVLAEPVLTGSDDATTLVLLYDDGGDRDALIAAIRAAGGGLDLLSPLDHRPPPCAAVARLAGTLPPLPPGWRASAPLAVDICETDPATLRG